MVIDPGVLDPARSRGYALFGRPRWLQVSLDVTALAMVAAVALQVEDPDVLFHVLWIVLALEAFAFGLVVSLARIGIAAVAVFAYAALAEGSETPLAARLVDLDLAEWPLMVIIVLLVSIMAYRVTAAGDRYAALYRRASDRLLRAQEDERQHLARDLHDGVGQMLTALTMTLDGAMDRLHRGDAAGRDAATEALGRARQLTTDTLEEVRSVALRLRPQRLAEIGLIAAIADLASTAGMPVDFAADPGLRRIGLLPPAAELEAYRIVQEALGNALRHANARDISITARLANPGTLRLEVTDDGIGIARDRHREGLGLTGMRERAASIDARLLVDSLPGQGTRVRLDIPLTRAVTAVVAADATLTVDGSTP
jgi:two-component system NarL family sensor kinase